MFAIYEWTPAKLTLVFTIYTTLFTFLQYGCPTVNYILSAIYPGVFNKYTKFALNEKLLLSQMDCF